MTSTSSYQFHISLELNESTVPLGRMTSMLNSEAQLSAVTLRSTVVFAGGV